MPLRTNKVLKLLALVLFTLQFLAPAILVDIANTECSQDKFQLGASTHQQNVLYSIFAEELTESEEGREGQKVIAIFADGDYFFALFQLSCATFAPSKYLSQISEQFDTQPALFKLNCTFRI